MKGSFRRVCVGLTSIALVAAVAACGSSSSSSSAGSSGSSGTGTAASSSSKAVKIGVLFPDNHTPLWGNVFWPSVQKAIKAQCANCQVLFANSPSDPTTQRNQADSMLAQGVKALILAPVDAVGAGAIVNEAKNQGVPVIGFGDQPNGPLAGYTGVDIFELGRLQGKTLLAALKQGGDPKRGCVVAIDGDAATPGEAQYRAGRKQTLDPYVNICKEYFTKNWDPATAQSEMDQAITALGKNKIIGVYAMNDGVASGAAAAMKNAGFSVPFPPMTGNDGEVAALQRILVGQQLATNYVLPSLWGKAVAAPAIEAARGEKLTSSTTISDGPYTYPWYKTPEPEVITKANMKADMIDPGYVPASQICTSAYAAACKAAGIS
jgi:D-xylose transport system substrate-binding protein